MGRRHRALRRVLVLAAVAPLVHAAAAVAQVPAPEVLDRDLAVRTAASGLSQPTTMAFLGRVARDRQGVATAEPRLTDGAADNLLKWDLTESENLLFGRNFGVVTDLHTGPEGDLYVVSLSTRTIYAIGRDGRESRLR